MRRCAASYYVRTSRRLGLFQIHRDTECGTTPARENEAAFLYTIVAVPVSREGEEVWSHKRKTAILSLYAIQRLGRLYLVVPSPRAQRQTKGDKGDTFV